MEDPVFIAQCAKTLVDKVEEDDKRKSQKERQTNMLNAYGRVMQVCYYGSVVGYYGSVVCYYGSVVCYYGMLLWECGMWYIYLYALKMYVGCTLCTMYI